MLRTSAILSGVSNRWFRFVIALVAIAAAGAAGYRIFQHEQQLARVDASTRAGAYAAESAISTISEIKAALHAYVAEGQEHDFWTARASMLIDKLRGSFADIDHAATANGVADTEELDLSDRLAAAEKRARAHLSAGRLLLAGEIIFTEARDLLDAMRIGIAGRRDAFVQAADRQRAEMRREQALLALGAAAVLAMAVLVLVPVGRIAVPERGTVSVAPPEPVVRDHRTAPVAAGATDAPKLDRHPKVRVGSIPPSSDPSVSPVAPSAAPAPQHRTAPAVPPAPVASVPPNSVPLAEAAAVCTDLGRVSQSNEISALLGRAAEVLTASGVIVWVASENRDELFPAAGSGYDERLFERIGSIRRDASNITAAAFRGGATADNWRGKRGAGRTRRAAAHGSWARRCLFGRVA